MKSLSVAVKALALSAAVGLFAHTAVSGVVYVTPTGDPTADGSDWANATTLAHACEIVPAGTASECSEIVLKEGTVESPAVYDYSSQVGGSCVATLTKANVRIRSAADDLDSRKVVIKGGGDYRRFLVSANGFQMAGLTVRDFMMTNGACIVSGPVALVTNCAFVANFSTNKVGAASASTGIYSALFCNTSASFCNCDFTDNIGGPYANNDELVNASCLAAGNNKLYGCRFTGNKGAVVLAVAAAALSSASLMATNCTFRENVGGVLNKHYKITNCTFMDCKFYGNRGDSRAPSGQRWCIGRGGSFVQCELGGNSSDTGFGGNGYTACLVTNNACGFAAASLTGCVVSNNVMLALTTTGSVTDTLVVSNAFNDSWAVTGSDGSSQTVKRSIFVRNRFKQCFLRGSWNAAKNGKAPRAEDCLFVSNVCTVANKDNTGIFFTGDGRYVAIGCTVVDNNCGKGYAFGPEKQGYVQQIANCLSFGNKPYDVYGGATYCMTNTLYGTIRTATTHAASVDSNPISSPKFSRRVDALHPFGYSLSARSPARGAGRDIGYALGAKDLTGVLPRVIDGVVDVGCYEYQPSAGLMLFVR